MLFMMMMIIMRNLNMICLVSGPTSDSLRSGIHGGAGGGLGQQIDGLLQETDEWRELQVSWTFNIHQLPLCITSDLSLVRSS